MPNIEFVTAIDYKSYRHFYLFHLLTRKFFKIFVIILAAILLLSLGHQIYQLFLVEVLTFEDFIPALIVLVVGFGFYGVFILFTYITFLRMKTALVTPIHYLFCDDYFLVAPEQDDIYRGFQFNYDQIYAIYEGKHHFYLFMNSQRSYILLKSDMKLGNDVKFRALLKEKTTCDYYCKIK